MSTLNTVNITNGTDSITVEGAVKGSAKAWVNFNGTGTVAIRASYNVSSITDNGTGDYTVNFTTAMVDANYNVSGTCGGFVTADNNWSRILSPFNAVSGSIQVRTVTDAGTLQDQQSVNVAIFR